MSEWKATTLGKFVSFQRGHDLPQRNRRPGSVPVVGSGGVTGWHDTSIAAGPGITIGRAANLGVPTLVESDFWPLNTTLYVTDFHGNDVRFTYYLLRTLDLTGFNSGSVQPMLNRNYIRNFPLTVPELPEQRAIAGVLGALDDKIAVNDRIAATSLSVASAYYASASAAETWIDIRLMDAADWYSGGTPRTTEESYWNGEIPWISAASLKSPWIDYSDRRLTSLGAQNGSRLIPKGTVIFVVRGMSLKTEFRIGLTQRQVAFGQDCKALVPASGVDSDVLFHAIRSKSEDVLDLVDEAGHGTGRLATDRLARMTTRVPGIASDPAIAVLHELDELAASRQRESRQLIELRDTLLPGLMSGAIRVRDAEKAVEDAA